MDEQSGLDERYGWDEEDEHEEDEDEMHEASEEDVFSLFMEAIQ